MGVTDMGRPCLKYEEHSALGKEMCQYFQGSDRKPGLEVRVSGFQPKAGSVQSRSVLSLWHYLRELAEGPWRSSVSGLQWSLQT